MPLSHSHCIVGNVSPLWFWLRLLILLLPSYFSLVFFRMWSKFLANHLLPCLPLIHSFFFFLGGYYRDPPRLCRECSLTCTQEAEKLRERAKKVENPSWFWFKLLLKRGLMIVWHTEAKILNLSKNSHFKISFFDKIHLLKISFLTKFTFWKSHFWQNSHFANLIFNNIHNLDISFLTKFTFWNSHFLT